MSINKYKHDNGELTLSIKGAPERMLKMCSHNQNGDSIEPIPAGFNKDFENAYKTMASRGQRVLALAYRPLDASSTADYNFDIDPFSYPESGYIFIGLLLLIDPPKDRVAKAIGSCQSAGITVIMVTGDHPLTAEAISHFIKDTAHVAPVQVQDDFDLTVLYPSKIIKITCEYYLQSTLNQLDDQHVGLGLLDQFQGLE